MGLRSDSARSLSVRAEPLTRWGRAESACNAIAANVKFSDQAIRRNFRAHLVDGGLNNQIEILATISDCGGL